MKSKIKVTPPPSLQYHNIIVFDTKAKKNRGAKTNAGFLEVKEAEDYIESHERPEDLVCFFNQYYEKRYLKNGRN